jgi:hypothetical protein
MNAEFEGSGRKRSLIEVLSRSLLGGIEKKIMKSLVVIEGTAGKIRALQLYGITAAPACSFPCVPPPKLLVTFLLNFGICHWVPGALSPDVKRPGREADDSPPTSAEVKKIWIYTSTPPYAFMA